MKKYRTFNPIFFGGIVRYNNIELSEKEIEREFEGIKREIIRGLADREKCNIVRKYGNVKISLYFKTSKEINYKKKSVNVRITAVYVNGFRIYEGYLIRARWELL